jgi:predicted HTH domain antitoxin
VLNKNLQSPKDISESIFTMQILVEVPNHLPDAAQCTPEQFMQDAKLAMAVKLFEMKRLSSGMAALLIGMTRVQFLGELHRFGVPMIDLDENELAQDVLNA